MSARLVVRPMEVDGGEGEGMGDGVQLERLYCLVEMLGWVGLGGGSGRV